MVLEALDGSITFHNYRARGQYSLWRREGFLGSLALTGARVLAYRFERRIVNISFFDYRIHDVEFSVPLPDVFQIAFESSLFRSDRCGRIEVRFKTPRAEDVCVRIQSLCRPTSRAR